MCHSERQAGHREATCSGLEWRLAVLAGTWVLCPQQHWDGAWEGLSYLLYPCVSAAGFREEPHLPPCRCTCHLPYLDSFSSMPPTPILT